MATSHRWAASTHALTTDLELASWRTLVWSSQMAKQSIWSWPALWVSAKNWTLGSPNSKTHNFAKFWLPLPPWNAATSSLRMQRIIFFTHSDTWCWYLVGFSPISPAVWPRPKRSFLKQFSILIFVLPITNFPKKLATWPVRRSHQARSQFVLMSMLQCNWSARRVAMVTVHHWRIFWQEPSLTTTKWPQWSDIESILKGEAWFTTCALPRLKDFHELLLVSRCL